MHLLSVNVAFRYGPIYALGVVTAYDRFLQGYPPERDKPSIFNALCQATGGTPEQYRQDAERLQQLAANASGEEIAAWLRSERPLDGAGDLNETLQHVANNPKFKYSRLFAIGLYTLLETSDRELANDDDRRKSVLDDTCRALGLPPEKFAKDLDLYRGNLEKMEQARDAIRDATEASRKQRERRASEQAGKTVPAAAEAGSAEGNSESDTGTTESSDPPASN